MDTDKESSQRVERILLTFQEAQELLRVSHQTLYNLMRQGLPSHKIGKKRVFLREELMKWIREQRERLTVQLKELERRTFTPQDIEALLRRVRSRLSSASPGDRRFVLEAVGASVFSCGDGSWEIELEVPKTASEELQVVSNQPGSIST